MQPAPDVPRSSRRCGLLSAWSDASAVRLARRGRESKLCFILKISWRTCLRLRRQCKRSSNNCLALKSKRPEAIGRFGSFAQPPSTTAGVRVLRNAARAPSTQKSPRYSYRTSGVARSSHCESPKRTGANAASGLLSLSAPSPIRTIPSASDFHRTPALRLTGLPEHLAVPGDQGYSATIWLTVGRELGLCSPHPAPKVAMQLLMPIMTDRLPTRQVAVNRGCIPRWG